MCAAGPLSLRGCKRRSRRKRRPGRKGGSRETGKKKKKTGEKGGRREHDSRERRKTGRERACNLRAHHESTGRERESEREIEKELYTFSSLRVEAPGRFSAARVSRGELVRSLQNTENTSLTLNYRAPSFHRSSFLFSEQIHPIYSPFFFRISILPVPMKQTRYRRFQ